MASASRTRSVSDATHHVYSIPHRLNAFCVPDLYVKAEDPSNYAEVIEIANRAGKQDDLV